MPSLGLPVPSNTVEFIIVAICATGLIGLTIWLRLGEKKKNDSGENRNGNIVVRSGSQSDDDRIKRVEAAIGELWKAIDKIKERQSDHTIDVMKELNEIKIMIVSEIQGKKNNAFNRSENVSARD